MTASVTAAAPDWIRRCRVPVLALALLSAALGVGGALPAVYGPIAAAVVLLALANALIDRRRREVPIPVWVMLGLCAFCLLQTVPIPIDWLRHMSPAAAEIWAQSLSPINGVVHSAPLTLDPPSTRYEALKWGSYAAICFVSFEASQKLKAPVVLGVIFGVGALVALVSLAHAVFEASTVMLVYRPRNRFDVGQIGPILNPNNLAGYLNLIVMIGVGLIVSRRAPASRWLLGVGLVLAIAVSLRSGSRGGIAGLGMTAVCMGCWLAVTRRTSLSARSLAVGAAALLTPAIAFALLGASKHFFRDVLSENAEKLKLISWAGPLVTDFRWFGSGRGSFGSVFFAYRPRVDAHVAFTHPENVGVQWLVEWGTPVAIAAGGALILSVGLQARRVGRSASLTGALIGLAGLAAHNMVDHSLELPAVGALAAAVLGVLMAGERPARMDARPPPQWRKRARYWGLVAAFGAVIGSGVMAAARGLTTLEDDRERIRLLLADRTEWAAVRAQIVRMMMRHPADHYFPLAGAFAARQYREPPMPWIQRALERGPTVGRTHALLAEVLLARGYLAQGLMELRAAATYEPGLSDLTADLALAFTVDPERLLVSVPEGAWGTLALDRLAVRLQQRGEIAAAEAMDRAALEREPSRIPTLDRLAVRRLEAMERATTFCEHRQRCADDVERFAAAMESSAPSDTRAARARARLLAANGDVAGAVALLASGCKAAVGRPECLLLRAQLLLREPSVELDAALEEYVAASCTARIPCADANAWVAARRGERGELQASVSAYERAARQDPSLARWMLVVEAAERASLPSTAIAALEEALKLDKDNGALKERLRKQRSR